MNSVLEVIEEKSILSNSFKIYGDVERPLFLARDVAEWIDYDRTSIGKMLATVDEDEKLNGTLFLSGQNRNVWFLTEDGLYEILMQIRKPIAKYFKKEVKKILKEIRTKGTYSVIPIEDILIQQLQEQKNIKNRVEKLENTMTIDYSQQEELSSLARRVVVEKLGGKHTPAYKMLGKKMFRRIWLDYQRLMGVNSYKNTSVKNFTKGKEILGTWEPDSDLRLMIIGANSYAS